MSEKLIQIHEAPSGIDIGSSQMYLCVKEGSFEVYDTYTKDLKEMVAYMLKEGVKSVAIEATGVLWMPLHDLLDEAGIEVYLVNGREVKQVPGRKSDAKDCQWLRQLHSYGLLRKGFVAGEGTRRLRTFTRLREDRIRMGASHINHMQKALELMNLKLHNVISQLTGKSGMKILKAIIAGERDPEVLAKLCNNQILNKKKELVIASLQGNYKEEYIFELNQAVEGWEFCQKQMDCCDQQIKKVLEELTNGLPMPTKELTAPKPIRHNKPNIDSKELHRLLMTLTGGTDPTRLSGMTDLGLLKLIGEVGTDMSAWKTEKHFASWATLAPARDSSGKRTRPRRKKGNHRVGVIFRQAAQSLAKSKYAALGGFYRRIKARRGPKIAIKATARKLAVLFYRMMKYGVDYVEIGLEKYEEQYREKQLKFLKKQAKELDVLLVGNDGVVY